MIGFSVFIFYGRTGRVVPSIRGLLRYDDESARDRLADTVWAL
jgi:hypothetical protein